MLLGVERGRSQGHLWDNLKTIPGRQHINSEVEISSSYNVAVPKFIFCFLASSYKTIPESHPVAPLMERHIR